MGALHPRTRLALTSASILTLTSMAVASGTATGLLAAAGPTRLNDPAVLYAAGPHDPGGTTSTHWAGFGTKGSYTKITASWIQPKVTCSQSSEVVFWVGLDGWGNTPIEQDGTGAACNGGSPQYFGWWETYPTNGIQSYNKTVKAGDHITASVTAEGGGAYLMTVADSTQNWTENTHVTAGSATPVSAEVIAEAPGSVQTGPVPLAKFGTVNFTASMVDGSAIGTLNAKAITMRNGGLVASTSALTNGEDFTVTWHKY